MNISTSVSNLTTRSAGRLFLAQALVLALLVAAVAAPIVSAAQASGVVNINTATAEELQNLPRVGPTVAQRIVDYRESNGRFQMVEDLLLVQGIGDRTFDLLSPYVVLDGETTLFDKVSSRGASGGARE